ncbi:MAG TPA: DUF4157 domain-containing protein [Gemmatimonadales bacterium]|nr:DUF4157 domain-containing protein [Gemmatimonadales bacterium]
MERLSDGERRTLGALEGWADLARVRVHRGTGGVLARCVRAGVLAASGGRAVTLGNHVFLPARAARDRAVLAHEVTHCGQFQRWGAARYFARGALVQARDLVHRLTGRGASPYAYALDGRPFEAYGMEQQGQLVEDAFRGDALARAVAPGGAEPMA